ncbi:hypothetical protein DSCOOX_60470 [Desulfosarcina ovata subsp. ovata]|uniref:Bacterial sugar transferase domain-containing protein n=1 Tax=Desulfosarcina ovata subsp. ovata TaxID=2752305 RepID=A0A5K8AJI9_9BACT|nr:hypothetical protein DSCOOX_60470 [Desulfosarcina ovata subsp. ovata]
MTKPSNRNEVSVLIFAGLKLLTNYMTLLWNITKSVALDFTFLAAGLYFYSGLQFSRDFVGYFALITFFLLLTARISGQLYLDYFSPKGFNVQRILIVGDQERGELVKRVLETQISWGHEIVGLVSIGAEPDNTSDIVYTIDELPTILRQQSIDEVVFAIPGDRTLELKPHLNYCRKIGLPVRILPAMWHQYSCQLSMEVCQGIPFLTMQTDNFNAAGLLYKRLLDIAGGLVGCLLFLLMYPFIAVAIKLGSKGPVLFRQKRMGQHGRVFELIKFRTMCADAEAKKVELLKHNQMNGAIFKLNISGAFPPSPDSPACGRCRGAIRSPILKKLSNWIANTWTVGDSSTI